MKLCTCGHEGNVRTLSDYDGGTLYSIKCMHCGRGTMGYDSKVEAIRAWDQKSVENLLCEIITDLLHVMETRDIVNNKIKEKWEDLRREL